jgi:hypothetical protein
MRLACAAGGLQARHGRIRRRCPSDPGQLTIISQYRFDPIYQVLNALFCH